MEIIPLQLNFRPAVRTVAGNVDYTSFERELKRLDELLRLSGAEEKFVRRSVEQYQWRKATAEKQIRPGDIVRHEKQSLVALRCVILKILLRESCRGMSRRLAEC